MNNSHSLRTAYMSNPVVLGKIEALKDKVEESIKRKKEEEKAKASAI